MPSIAAIDPRCFVSPPAPRPEASPRPPQETRTPRPNVHMTWRPPLERAKTRA
jgi:hypothetical protein